MSELHVIFGTGPLGRFTAENLLAQGHRVRLISRSGAMKSPPAGAEVLAADALDNSAVAPLLAGARTVYQCAQPAYDRWAQEFPQLQDAIVQAAMGAGAKLVVAENLYGYGNTHGKPMTENLPYQPCSKKGQVRADMSKTLFDFHAAGKIKIATVRGSDFWGPWEPIQSGMIFKAALEGKPVNLLGRLDQPHSFTYVKDFGRALAVAGTDDRALGRAWHVPSGPAPSQQELIDLLAQVLGKPVKAQAAGKFLLLILGLFNPMVREVIEMLYEFTEPFVLDSTAMESTFGLKATALKTRIEETLAWVQSS